jgi:two-component system, OmpR family, phosphate regulon response regulator PhoB
VTVEQSNNGRPRVLVVDDEAALRELIVVTLGDAFRCDEASDGEAALTQLRRSPPDIVFLDVMLPGLGGIDVLREIRTDPALRTVGVVVVSAWQAEEDIALAFESGADGFLPKPFRVEDVLSIAEELVGRRG